MRHQTALPQRWRLDDVLSIGKSEATQRIATTRWIMSIWRCEKGGGRVMPDVMSDVRKMIAKMIALAFEMGGVKYQMSNEKNRVFVVVPQTRVDYQDTFSLSKPETQ